MSIFDIAIIVSALTILAMMLYHAVLSRRKPDAAKPEETQEGKDEKGDES